MNGPMAKYYIAMIALSVVGLVAVVWQYSLSRSTFNDQQKVSDISALQNNIDNYYQDNAKLPAALNDLSLDEKLTKDLPDYEYSKTSNSYTLCANFATDVSDDVYGEYGDNSVYFHGKGRRCFTRDALDHNYNPEGLCDASNLDLLSSDYSSESSESLCANP